MTARPGGWPASNSPATASSATSTWSATTRTAATRRRCAASCIWCRPRAGRSISPRCSPTSTTATTRSPLDNSTQHVVGPARAGCAAHAGRLDENSRRHSPAAGEFLSTTAYADSDIVYSFDGDWGNDAYWGEFAPYDYFSRYDRDRSTLSQDLRWQGPAARRHRLGRRCVCAATHGRFPAARLLRAGAAAANRCTASTRRPISPSTVKPSGSVARVARR